MSDWIDISGIGVVPMTRSAKEYAVEYHNGVIMDRSPNEGQALIAVQDARRLLNSWGIPEEYWPIVVEREVRLDAGHWCGRL